MPPTSKSPLSCSSISIRTENGRASSPPFSFPGKPKCKSRDCFKKSRRCPGASPKWTTINSFQPSECLGGGSLTDPRKPVLGTSTRSNTMDVHCSSCGEAWDAYHLWHDAVYDALPHEEAEAWEKLSREAKRLDSCERRGTLAHAKLKASLFPHFLFSSLSIGHFRT